MFPSLKDRPDIYKQGLVLGSLLLTLKDYLVFNLWIQGTEQSQPWFLSQGPRWASAISDSAFSQQDGKNVQLCRKPWSKSMPLAGGPAVLQRLTEILSRNCITRKNKDWCAFGRLCGVTNREQESDRISNSESDHQELMWVYFKQCIQFTTTLNEIVKTNAYLNTDAYSYET